MAAWERVRHVTGGDEGEDGLRGLSPEERGTLCDGVRDAALPSEHHRGRSPKGVGEFRCRVREHSHEEVIRVPGDAGHPVIA